MRRLRGFLIGLCMTAALGTGGAPVQAADDKVEVRLQWLPQAKPAALQAEIVFRGQWSGQTEIVLPGRWASANDYAADLKHLQALGAARVLDPDAPERSATPQRRRVVHAPGALVHLRWRIEPVDPEPVGHEGLYRNQVSAAYFHTFGHGWLVLPATLADPAAKVDWQLSLEAPRGQALVSSFGSARGGRLVVRRQGSPLAELRHALYAGGDFRVAETTVSGQPLTVALRGRWKFADGPFVHRVTEIVESQFGLFAARPPGERFAITLIENRVDQGSVGGTLVGGAFALAASADLDPGTRTFTRLVAHEHMHRWVPQVFGRMTVGADRSPAAEARHYWFSEGFTDHLTHTGLVRAGLWGLADYVDTLNERVGEWLANPRRDAPGSQAAQGFFSDGDLQRLPYLRGEWLALRWQAALGAHGGLGPVLQALAVPGGWQDGSAQAPNPAAALATERLLAALEGPLAGRARAEVERHVERGEMVAFDADLLGPCFEGRAEPVVVYDLGFDLAALREWRRLERLVEGSPLQRAGAREGDGVVTLSAETRPDREARITLRREGGEPFELRFLPRREVPGQTRPVYAVRAGAPADPACQRWFGTASLKP